jgi:3-hydroxybutyryl-CoA dehydrogenase
MALTFENTAVVGTGAMGRGIAQIAAQAGSTVWLYDAQPAAVEAARASLVEQWEKLAAKGKMAAEQLPVLAARLRPRRHLLTWRAATWWWRPLSRTWA